MRVLVTGGTRGIGEAIVRKLAGGMEGFYQVYFTYKDSQGKAMELKREFPEVHYRKMDLARREDLNATVNWAKPQILINNAAIANERPVEDITNAEWNTMLDCNLTAPFIMSRQAANYMKGWGRIINIASIGGQWGGTNQVHYSVAKAGLICLTKSLAKAYIKKGITVNAVSPGVVDTDMGRKTNHAEVPMGRMATPEEVASAVVYLVSKEAGYITGQTINVNGGQYFG